MGKLYTPQQVIFFQSVTHPKEETKIIEVSDFLENQAKKDSYFTLYDEKIKEILATLNKT